MTIIDFLATPQGRAMRVIGRYSGETFVENHNKTELVDEHFILRGQYRDIYFLDSAEITPYGEAVGGGFTVADTEKVTHRLVPFMIIPVA
jgi:hypothetical protein